MRRVAVAVACVLLAGGAARAGPTIGQCEGGDASGDRRAPSALGVPAACTGELSNPSDREDWYGVTLRTGDVLTAVLSGAPQSDPNAPLGARLEIRDPTQAIRSCPVPDQRVPACVLTIDAAGTWGVGVIMTAFESTPYVLHVTVAPPSTGGGHTPSPDEPCETGDAGGTPEQASRLRAWNDAETEFLCEGALATDGSDSADWYWFRVRSLASALRVVVQPAPWTTTDPLPRGDDVAARLIRTDGSEVAPAYDGGAGRPRAFLLQPAPRGMYRLGIAPSMGQAGATYTLAVSIVSL